MYDTPRTDLVEFLIGYTNLVKFLTKVKKKRKTWIILASTRI